jgi:hypothetical protein
MSKRKAYRPRPIVTDPLTFMRPADPARRTRLLAKFWSALESMSRGQHPGEDDWRLLSDAVNTMETMVIKGKLVAAEVMPILNAAIAAMVGAANRYRAGQGMRLDGAGLQALRDVVDVYRQCLEGHTERDMARMQAETERRMRALLTAKAPRKELVML